MIISTNTDNSQDDFEKILKLTIDSLNKKANESPDYIITLKGEKLEPVVKDILEQNAKGTSFENTIELVSGQKFPDIVAKKYFGIEVKTTIKNHWKTTGNSVLESTRVEGVERIYMLFGKLGKPIEFRCRPYEECLSEIVVTHSPRYLIDMNLKEEETIFSKIDIGYDVLRKKKNPIKPITKYYKSKLKKGESLWWIDNVEGQSSNVVVRFWKHLSRKEQNDLQAKAMVFFPEIFGKGNDKYNQFALWLITQHGIVHPNVRDSFSAAGKKYLKHPKYSHVKPAKIIFNLEKNINAIREVIRTTSANDLGRFWKVRISAKGKKYDWITQVVNNFPDTDFDLKMRLEEFLKEIV